LMRTGSRDPWLASPRPGEYLVLRRGLSRGNQGEKGILSGSPQPGLRGQTPRRVYRRVQEGGPSVAAARTAHPGPAAAPGRSPGIMAVAPDRRRADLRESGKPLDSAVGQVIGVCAHTIISE
jgi:hypothetical protein